MWSKPIQIEAPKQFRRSTYKAERTVILSNNTTIIMKNNSKAIFLALLFFAISCSQPTSQLPPTPNWAVNATIYEVNIRQYSDEGTFDKVTEDLDRIQDLGAEIIWLMPINPIGELNRKGSMGSYYSVKDYKAVNPEFGTDEDFRELIKEAHKRDIKVIIDWVPNHTAWDHVWTETNPEFFTKDSTGNFIPPVADWSDVIDLNFDNFEMREEMIQAMEYWIREFDIDGYRVDVAWGVPTDFHEDVRRRLETIKPVFMLAEADMPEHHNYAFDMSYTWGYNGLIYHVAQGDSTLSSIHRLMLIEQERYPDYAYRMYFTTNHDENSWKGSDPELYLSNFEPFAIMSATIDGMPLIYSGQEGILGRRLEFFEKDAITWNDYPRMAFFEQLLELNQANSALWNGTAGGPYELIDVNDETGVYGYRRANEKDEVIVWLNISSEPRVVSISGNNTYEELFSTQTFSGSDSFSLEAHSGAVFVKKL